MQVSRLSSIVCCGLLLIAPALPVHGQKKDGKNSAPTVRLDVTPITPYSEVRRDNLLNGLQVISLYRPGDAIVKCDIVVRTGSMFDLLGKAGLASLTQATLLAANPRLKEELESLQARIDWGINTDTTWFHVETPAASFDTVFEILARLLVVETPRNDSFAAAQKAQIERVKSHQPTAAERADEAFFKAVYGDHPYGRSPHGTEITLAGIKQGDIYDFLRRFYIANNVSVTTVGNIPQERVMKSFKILFGGWSKGQLVPATFRQPPQVTQLRVVKVEAADSANVELRGGVISVKHTDADFLTTEVMARILTARLKREAEGAAVTSTPRILSGPFVFSATLPAERAQAFSQKATEHYASLATTPVSAEELSAAKASLAGEYAARPVEVFLREIEVFSLPRNYPLSLQKRIDEITAADVQRVAQRLRDANALTVVALGRIGDNFKANP
ncbi:MAG: pitrilysin family protein [Blastocatellia bacterium]|nr:pitrilysin family protein [Blastocatellia bacterium]